MYILGISSYYHDSAAALIKDGEVICATEEERFSRIKHDNNFPIQAIEFCLKQAGITSQDIEYIAYYEKPLLKFERILETFVRTYPHSLKPFVKGLPEWFSYKIKVEQTIRKSLQFKKKVFFIPHHYSHAAAAYYPSEFKQSAILTIDGVGEYQTTVLWKGKENKIIALKSINFPDSLGLLYSTFTAFLGFRVNEDEYKVMGLAAYGTPIYKDQIYKMIDVKQDGSFKMDMKYFSYRESFSMWNKEFENVIGKPRSRKRTLTQRHKDIAASIQTVTEEIYFKILNHLYTLTKSHHLCVGGGVALNSLANGKIYNNTPFKQIYIMGAAGDGGSAIGAALYTHHSILKNKRRIQMDSLQLGPDYSDNDIKQVLKKYKLKYRYYKDHDLIQKAALLLSQGKIVGWFQKKMELGPRALGNRSILARPYPFSMKEKLNQIKQREEYRPFAGSVLQEFAGNYFYLPKTQQSFPFMNFCFQVKKGKRKHLAAITHQDNTCRIQTVNKSNGRYYDLISEFNRLTKIPCIMNTSFNVNHEPIVENPNQAITEFLSIKMDKLIIGNFVISKN